MTRSRFFAALLCAGTGLTAVPALAQSSQPITVTPPTGPNVAVPSARIEEPQQEVEISVPGGTGAEIVVQGRYIPEPIRNTGQVLSVLSNAEIARTGDGDIAGALERVTGLSVSSQGFVYVRGLGDRYSLALLNGLALPSPEPLRRVVPLDVFPTSVVASAIVQKSYSVNYPGEYGGGVINLTTASLPKESFLTIGVGGSGDTETSAELGYTYYGSDTDYLGYDDGTRDLPAALRNNDGQLVSASVLENEDTLIIQRNRNIPFNFSGSGSAGYVTDFGGTRLGIVANLGFSNGWRTRGATQQSAQGGSLLNSIYGVRTENRIKTNGLLGLGLDFADGHTVRFTNVYIHDTSKVARVRGIFNNVQTPFEDLTEDRLTGPTDFLEYQSSFVERQLFTTQLVTEFDFEPFKIDLRGAYSKSDRNSPYERTTRYRYDTPTGGYAADFSDPTGVNFSTLDEDVWSGAANITYDVSGPINGKLSAGYAYDDTNRSFESLEFLYESASFGNTGIDYLPIYLILTPEVIDYQAITLRQTNRAFGFAQYLGDLTVHAGYVRGDFEVAQGLRLEAGVRYETAEQLLTLPDVYNNRGGADTGNALVIAKENDYWLPAATLTWNFADNLQARFHASKTIARPQFRELGTIDFVDVETDRRLSGNPFLTDSELLNAEARLEFYPARGERMSIAAFFKEIDKPIESLAVPDSSGTITVTTANAPMATLYGAEAEVLKFFPLESLGSQFSPYQLVLSANYTYSKSELVVGADDTTAIFVSDPTTPLVQPASQVFVNGSPLTGQSEHLANLQFGIENKEFLSQLTVLLNYASERVIARGANSGGSLDPDIIEEPGLTVDVVIRQSLNIPSFPDMELKLEARNIFGRDHIEQQTFANGFIDSNSYEVGTSFGASLSAKF